MNKDFEPLSPKVVLGIAAHPDDLDFGSAGTMAYFAKQGAAVYYLLLTDGSKGSADTSIDPADLIKTRQQEQIDALKVLGGKEVDFLAYPDGGLEVTQDLKRDIVRVIRQRQPDVVVCMDPSMIYSTQRNFINHPDHRAAGQAALDAVYPLARDHLSFPELYKDEGLQPHKTHHVLLNNFENHNFAIDISSVIDTKMEAVAAHASQVPDLENMQTFFRQIAADTGQQYGYEYAEAFVRLDIQ